MVSTNFRLVALVCFLGIGITVKGFDVTARKCETNEFLCDDGIQCAILEYRCNNRNGGCYDGSDEGENCRKFNCVEGYRKCADNLQCVPEKYWCDTEADCDDGSDELDCESHECVDGYRKCADNLQCVSDWNWCDGSEDCDDGSDETSCSKTVCVSVAIDISESLDDPIHLAQEIAFLEELWMDLNSRFDNCKYIMTFIFFNNDVNPADVVEISSTDYTDQDDFLDAEESAFDGIRSKINSTVTSGLTNLGAVTDYVIDLYCMEDQSILFIISDFIFTTGRATNPEQIRDLMDEIKDEDYVVVAVALDKERIEENFVEVGDASGYMIDVSDPDYIDELTDVLDDILPI